MLLDALMCEQGEDEQVRGNRILQGFSRQLVMGRDEALGLGRAGQGGACGGPIHKGSFVCTLKKPLLNAVLRWKMII